MLLNICPLDQAIYQIITVKHPLRVHFDGSCYISLVFPLKKNVKQTVFTFFSLPLLIFLSILFHKTRYFIRNGNSDQSKTEPQLELECYLYIIELLLVVR